MMFSPRVWLLLVAVTVYFSGDLAQATFTMLPAAHTTAIAGETITLNCSALSSSGIEIIWSKGRTHLTYRMKLSKGLDNDVRSRYSLTGNKTAGELNLRIENVKKADAGDYQCLYTGEHGGETSPPATVTVLVPPRAEYPLCHVRAQAAISGTPNTLWPGKGAEFTCQSSGGDPPASLQWLRANHSILEPQTSNIVYERILLPEDNGVEFTCVATSQALRQPRICIVMPMRIPPVVQVKPLTRMIIPGDNATFHCEGSAIPHVESYSWRVAGRDVPDDHPDYSFANQRRLLTLHDVKSSHDKIEVSCKASTPTGISKSASVNMIVTRIYVPPPTETPTSVDFTPTPPQEGPGGRPKVNDNDIDSMIDGDLFMIIITIFGALVVLLLILAVVMGCWALNAKGKRPQTQRRPRVEYHESTSNTIDMDPLPTQLIYEPPTTISSDPVVIPSPPNAANNEDAPGYISQLYSTLDNNRLPARTAFVGFSDRPVAQITPTQGVASTLPRMSKIDKPTGVSKPTIKECPPSFTIPEENDSHPEKDTDLKKEEKK
ncbi:uncharacterized protein [Asterias amurensis]|uniref:uncharacterized protein n=1 Tax=Asterias amurensis TaxID=7602 RepID=UPI003AB79974